MNEEKLTFDELEFLFKRLLIFMKKWGIKDVSFDAKDDLYFKIWHQDRQFTEEFLEKPDYTLSSLADNITGLRRLLDDEEFPATLDVERMGAILTAWALPCWKRLICPKSKPY